MKVRYSSWKLLPLALGLVGAVACSSSGTSTQSAAEGTETGPCTAEGGCNEGLVCLSGVCVDPNSGGRSDGGPTAQGTSGSGSGGAPSGGGSSSGQAGAASGSGGNASGDGGATSAGGVDGNGGAASGGTTSGGASNGDAGPAVECVGAHPNVNGTSRTCAADACYCTSPFDTCFPASTAEACCETTPLCLTDSGPGGVDCAGAHPIIGPPRTCEPGNCLCSDGSTIDVCLPSAVAEACCPPDVPLDCVPAN